MMPTRSKPSVGSRGAPLGATGGPSRRFWSGRADLTGRLALMPPILVLALICGASRANAAPPDTFQLPFPCGEVWNGATRSVADGGHPTGSGTYYALDFNQGSGFADFGKPVLASEAGQVTYTGGTYGAVRISHANGWETRYLHLSAINVGVGPVAQGQQIGAVGDTGSPGASHLHYEQRLNGTLMHIVFNGVAVTYSFVYNGPAFTSYNCPVACDCDDGDQQEEPCGDCGARHRTCDDGCQWSAWTACEGPDPTDATCIPEGETGSCANGRQLCLAGWLTCQPSTATTEICDGVDNDCDGVVDNGTPQTLGEGYTCDVECGEGQTRCVDGALACVRVSNDSCDGTQTGDGTQQDPSGTSNGCGCQSGGPTGTLPAGSLLVLLLLFLYLGRSRRWRWSLVRRT